MFASVARFLEQSEAALQAGALRCLDPPDIDAFRSDRAPVVAGDAAAVLGDRLEHGPLLAAKRADMRTTRVEAATGRRRCGIGHVALDRAHGARSRGFGTGTAASSAWV